MLTVDPAQYLNKSMFKLKERKTTQLYEKAKNSYLKDTENNNITKILGFYPQT